MESATLDMNDTLEQARIQSENTKNIHFIEIKRSEIRSLRIPCANEKVAMMLKRIYNDN